MNFLFFIIAFIILLSLMMSPFFTLIINNMGWKKSRSRVYGSSVLFTLAYAALWYVIASNSPDDARWFKNTLGVITLAVCFSLIYWLIYKTCSIFKKAHWLEGKHIIVMLIVSVSFFSILGSYNFHKRIAVEEFTLSSEKISKNYRFVQISDIQFGTSTRLEMEDILDAAYSQNADFIVFTGDLIDFNHYSFSDFKKLAASPVPVFFERGNHEFYHHPQRLLAYLKKIAPIDVLINRSVDFDELQIIGLDFSRAPNNVAKQLERITVNPDKFSILLYHEPRDVEVAASYGIDVLLYGHTHAGQMWPYTWLVDIMYKYSDGAFKVGNSFAYTSDGASLWGPRMRLGSQNEIAVFNLVPKKSKEQ